MKGISTVVATIMLLMVTVALVGLAYLWATGVFTTTTTAARETTTQVTESLQTQFSIEAAKNATTTELNITIRNSGTNNIDGSLLGAYVDDLPATILDTIGTVSPKTTQSFRIRTQASLAGSCSHTLKLTLPGAEASKILTTC